MSTNPILVTAVAGTVAYGVYKLFVIIYGEWSSPIRRLRGPKSSSWLFGNIREVFDSPTAADPWIALYGPTFQLKGPLGFCRLYTLDPKAQSHVIMNADIYERPLLGRQNLARIVGPGVLVSEGEDHRRQRKVMNPAFGPAQIRGLTGIFINKSIELRDVWLSQAIREGGTGRIDVLSWLSRMTLDVIGLAGFNYSFDALKGDKPNELNQAFSTIFHGDRSRNLILLRNVFPPLAYIKTSRDRVVDNAQSVMQRIGRDLLESSKAAVAQSQTEKPTQVKNDGLRSRNLLSLLVKANTSDDVPASSKLSDEDVVAQIPTFLVAGHETTSTATTWALFSLSQNPDIQSTLREELLSVSTETPTMDELNSLPYLDRVVREALRIHSPVPMVGRVAVVDDVIPLSYPVTDSEGVTRTSIEIKAGQNVMLPIATLNNFASIWGEDANEFKPDRWLSPPEASSAIPGVWSNQMTFLGGSRACIGYRFSLIEMKALLFTLVRAFEFELAVPAADIGKKSMIVQRPVLKSDPKAGNALPMFVRPFGLA